MNTTDLVQTLKQANVLDDERVAAAFEAVPRHLFLPGVPLETVYADNAIYNRTDDFGGFIGGSDQPSQVAKLLTLAQIEPGQNILQIGAGTGYTAALIQHLVGDSGFVTAIELDRAAAETAQDNLQRIKMGSVNVVNADAAGGYSPRASYDRIISAMAIWDVPPTWLRELRRGGLIVTPIVLDGLQVIATFSAQEDGAL